MPGNEDEAAELLDAYLERANTNARRGSDRRNDMTDDDRISRLADKFEARSLEELLESEEFRQLSDSDAAALTEEFNRRAAAFQTQGFEDRRERSG